MWVQMEVIFYELRKNNIKHWYGERYRIKRETRNQLKMSTYKSARQ